jgi:hypothetical protein
MGTARDREFDAVIGVGGIGPEAGSNGIDGQVNWIGIGPHKRYVHGKRGPEVLFDHYLAFGTNGPDFCEIAPQLAARMYGENVRSILDGMNDAEHEEAERSFGWPGVCRPRQASGRAGCVSAELLCVAPDAEPVLHLFVAAVTHARVVPCRRGQSACCSRRGAMAICEGPTMKRWGVLLVAVLPVIAIVVVGLHSRGGSVQPTDLAKVPIDVSNAQSEDLGKLIDRADRLIVLQEPWDGAAVLFESSKRRDLSALKASLRVERPEQYLHCMCFGTPAIFLYANGRKIGQVTNHHAHLVRCSLWESDARLENPEAFLKWFDERNIPGPRKEYEEGLKRDKEYQGYEQKWVEGMPAGLRPLWPAARCSSHPDFELLRNALAEQLPEKSACILALFSWYGSGAGPWSGYPSYEDIAEKMLLDYSTDELLAAVEGKEQTEAQTEGVARLFGGWTFSQLRPNDYSLLSADLKARLLKHSLASADDDKRGRARRAFGKE